MEFIDLNCLSVRSTPYYIYIYIDMFHDLPEFVPLTLEPCVHQLRHIYQIDHIAHTVQSTP